VDLHAINILQPFNGWMELRHFLAILISCACGLAIGYERTSRNKQAGVKTHMIVALTSCLMMIISKEAFLDTPHFDTARVAAQVVSGISFIGGGIIFMRDKRVSGLTTASGIWATAGIGLAIGGGFWFFGAVCSAVIVIVQKLAYEPLLQRKSRQVNIYCEIPNPTIVQSIYNYCHFGDYQSIQVEARELDDEKYELVIRIQNDEEIVIENLKNYIRETENQVVIKRVKLRTEDVN
jgi:mgtC family protein